MAGDANTSTQTMSFTDHAPGQIDSRGSPMDHTRDYGMIHDADLNNFFSRPVKIFETAWETNSPLFARIDPWSAFWENPRVLEKITHYALLRCTMNVKLLINGNAFYYGRGMMSYEPLAEDDGISYNKLVRNNAYDEIDLIRSSQRMKVFFNPTESEGGSLKLPFFWYRNALTIPGSEWNQMGQLVLQSINDLRHANGSTNPVSISIFAWAENVSVSIPTAARPGDEMGFADEHNRNIISKPASNVARVASSLSSLPWIGRFAKATEIGATGVAEVAKIFGYSSPPELNYSVVVPNAAPSMAVVDTKRPCHKLTIDSKQELTIDPVTTGISAMDELAINSIACRESYITKFRWNMSDEVGDHLFSMIVDPAQTRIQGSEIHLTACALAVFPFKYWRGTMRVRFQIVSSNYHKGRLQIAYDPLIAGSSREFNTHYTTIHDISTDKDFSIDIGWGKSTAFREHMSIDNTIGIGASLPPSTLVKGNGYLSVNVLNELTVPGAVVSDIDINVFVSMLDDFEVAQPSSRIAGYTVRNPANPVTDESGEGSSGALEGPPEGGTPVSDPPIVDSMGDTYNTNAETTKVFFGEVIGSFRQMIKRPCLSEVHLIEEYTAGMIHTISRRAFPQYWGRLKDTVTLNPGSFVTSFVGGQKWIVSSTNYITFLAPAYAGWRGSIRWTHDISGVVIMGRGDRYLGSTLTVSRNELNTGSTTRVALNPDYNNIPTRIMNAENRLLLNGAHLGVGTVNPLVSVEIPFYSNERFRSPMKVEKLIGANYEPSYDMSLTTASTVNATDRSYIKSYCSAGEDFNFFYFNGLPPLFFEAQVPVDF
jgi:hypothetical protein